jgi:hypothetical protein
MTTEDIKDHLLPLTEKIDLTETVFPVTNDIWMACYTSDKEINIFNVIDELKDLKQKFPQSKVLSYMFNDQTCLFDLKLLIQ